MTLNQLINYYDANKPHASILSQANSLRAQFVKDYSITTLQSWNWNDCDKYVAGKGNKTFCYRLEWELAGCGSISNSRANKYGIYFSTINKKYIYTKKYGNNAQVAFQNVICEIIKLLKAGAKHDSVSIKSSPLCNLVRGKLLFVYYPNLYLPIYGKDHLLYFANKLNIKNVSQDIFDLQQAILRWKNRNSITKQWSNLEFEDFLYFAFGKPIKKAELIERELDEELNEKIDNLAKSHTNENDSEPINDIKKFPEKPIIIQGHKTYPRDPKISRNALNSANHCCEYDPNHPTFKRKNCNENYTEPHHLIPMRFQDLFPQASLDTEANIVSLCSNCHNCIHYGKDAPTLLKKLLKNRQSRLAAIGININDTELIKLYK